MPDAPRQIRLAAGDYYMHGQDHKLRRAGLPGYICRVALRLEDGLDVDRLRRRLPLRLALRLTRWKNVLLGMEPVTALRTVDVGRLHRLSADILGSLGVSLDTHGEVRDLPVAIQQSGGHLGISKHL